MGVDKRGLAAKISENSIPDLCQPKGLLIVLLLAFALSFVHTLARYQHAERFWVPLGTTALFLTWLGLISAAVLCAYRRYTHTRYTRITWLVCYALLVGVTAIVTEVAYWLRIGLGQPFSVGHVQLHAINLGIAATLFAALLRYFFVQELWKQQLFAANRAKIEALQARIRPHFLFNSLNTIAALTAEDPPKAERAIEHLSDLFRASLDEATFISVKDELAFCRTYLELETLRVGERLRVRWDIDASAHHLLMPRLILQPLLENAVYHGIEAITGNGCIQIRCNRHKASIEFAVTNPTACTGTPSPGHQLAVANIQAQLAVLYGDESRFETSATDGQFMVTFRIPVVEPS